MPATEVVFYMESDATCPVLDWLDDQQDKIRDKCIVRIERLEELGHELRRPEADYLGDDIYELRISYRRVQYRIFYFFHGGRAVLARALVKEGAVPEVDIQRAQTQRSLFVQDSQKHTYES